ncbi:hypothetical protein [Pseudoxanthomonas dokdonensis]|uniref:TnsA endonuclease N-terminal domain-containing protein n=1 Tax=Pseudoxanthomonas dokdonensis TaxID=344882 RepID=A0A0R0CZG8_9GAMM|nr:hypothetical protein [Pseudoxanthomonas dokdonensis]KRG70536.1 hypothetical protein ABB29_05545 [Pseudoxanthomonas dokdonensis]
MSAQVTQDAGLQARELSLRELKRQDIYFYDSPKLGRRVTVVEPSRLALALELEFDPAVVTYVPRPRLLDTQAGRIELCFWSCTKAGLEQFHSITYGAAGDRKTEQRRTALLAAAAAAQIALRLEPQAQYLHRATANANRLRLLPYVQTALHLAQRETLSARVMEAFRFHPRQTFHQLERTMDGFDPSDVRATACALVHAGHLKLDWCTRLQRYSALEQGEGA